MPKRIALAKTAVPIDRERRMVGHLVVKLEATKPAIGKVKLHFLAQPALRTDAVAVADNQHPDHELGVDRRPADLAVEGRQLLAKLSHYPRHHRIDAANKMARRNATFEVEEIEQLALIDLLPTHHDPPPPPRTSGRRNHDSHITTRDFFNSIGQKRKGSCRAILVRFHRDCVAKHSLRGGLNRDSVGRDGDSRGRPMMGRREGGQGQFFYEFDLDEVVPADHLVRQIDGLLDLSWVHKELAPYYSRTGRPSIDPVLMIRMLIVGYAFAIRSERRLCSEVRVNLAYRWFCKLGIEDKIPDHSVFSRARHERFRESNALRRVFEGVVAMCIVSGLVGGEAFSIDASLVEADAGRKKRVPGDQPVAWPRAEEASRAVREYLA